jgi:dual-specificity kinase
VRLKRQNEASLEQLLTSTFTKTAPTSEMSTIPAQPSQYSYSHHNAYPQNPYGYPAKNTLPAPRMTNYNFPPLPPKQSSHPAPMPVSQSTPALSTSNRSGSQRKPDWHEFYKNGVPKEVILIDDDTPPPRQQPSRQGRRGQEMGGAPLPQPSAGKKRKIDQSYGQEYHDSPAFSTHPAHFGDTASVSSHSGTRTTSHQTTAPTSLESYGSNAASNSYEDVNVGQKRKRAQPQKETRAQVKRKQQEATSDAFHDYVPPPAPVRKAPEVHVPVIRDVSGKFVARGRSTRTYMKKTSLHKTTKVDDDDGHYIINPGTALTERCMLYIHVNLLGMLTILQTI